MTYPCIIKLVVFLSLIIQALSVSASPPVIKKGDGTVIVKIDAPDSIRSIISADIYYMPVFTTQFESQLAEKVVNGIGDLIFKVPMELDEVLVTLRIADKESGIAKAVGLIGLNQKDSLIMTCKYLKNGDFSFMTSEPGLFNDLWIAGKVGANDNVSSILGDIMARFMYFPYGLTEKRVDINASNLDNWRVMKQKYDSICDIQISTALNGQRIPDVAMPWFGNNLKYFSFGRFPLMYRIFGKNIP